MIHDELFKTNDQNKIKIILIITAVTQLLHKWNIKMIRDVNHPIKYKIRSKINIKIILRNLPLFQSANRLYFWYLSTFNPMNCENKLENSFHIIFSHSP